MVRFGARLRENTYAEWRDDYLDYQRLKKELKRQRDADRQQLHDAAARLAKPRNSTLSETMPLLRRRSVRRRPLGSTTSLDTNDDDKQFRQEHERAGTGFEELLSAQYAKVERAYEHHLDQLSDQLACVRQQHHPAASRAARDSVRQTLVELHRLLNHLLNFAVLNYTGFVKILEKHDAMFPARPPLMRAHSPRLHAFAFADATQCRALLAQVELTFADLFCQGDRAVATASLMTRQSDMIDWAPVYIGIKIGACLILLMWVVWDSLVVPALRSERERHLIDLARTRAYPVYRGIGCCLLLHWLVGVSTYVWHSARINYRYIFELDPRTTPHYTDIFSDATNMSIVYLVNVLMYYKVVNGYVPEQLLHRGYYPLALFVYTIYFYVLRKWRAQRGLAKTLVEIVGAPFFPVTFFHVFVANYVTSFVKVSQDLAWSVCFFVTGEFLVKERMIEETIEADVPVFSQYEVPYETNAYYIEVAIPLICALPLWWRFLQNLRRIYDTGTWWPHLPSAAMYALAQVVALFGLFHPFYDSAESNATAFQLVWVMLFTISSLYTWIWDVWMDWGLGRPQYKFLGDRHMFARVWVYYAAICADLFLRFAWTLTLIPPRSSRSLPLYVHPFTMVLELFRRTFWGFFRLENEHLRNTQGFRRVDYIPLHYDHGVGVGDDDDRSDDGLEPLQANVFLVKILLILFLVLGLSVLAVTVDK